MMKTITNVKSLLVTACAVGVLVAANQAWADTIVTNCTQVFATVEADTDSQPANMAGSSPAQDDESCAAITIVPIYDFGDAPDTYGTKLTATGAQHEIIPGLKLGTTVDNEADGQPTTEADGDGTDEDGVTIPPLMDSDPLTLSVKATNTTGTDATLSCWIDYNGDGQFATDNSEFGSAPVPSNLIGETTIAVPMPAVPATASKDTNGTSYARCRLSSAAMDATKATGAMPDGEVEDYKVTFTEIPVFDLALRKRLADGQADTVKAGDTVQFTIDVINQGNLDASNIVVTDYIPAGMELADTNWTANAAGTMATLNTPIATLAKGGAATVVSITLKVIATTTAGGLTNIVEISSATGGTDKDSTPDAVLANDGTVKDDEVTEDGKNGGDEDDHDIAKVTVAPTVDVALSKAVTDVNGNPITTAHLGDTLVYVLTVVNTGNDPATGVVVKDLLPAQMSYVSHDAITESYVPASGIWTIGDLGSGMSKTLKISVTVK